jgi:hypothetical protein
MALFNRRMEQVQPERMRACARGPTPCADQPVAGQEGGPQRHRCGQRKGGGRPRAVPTRPRAAKLDHAALRGMGRQQRRQRHLQSACGGQGECERARLGRCAQSAWRDFARSEAAPRSTSARRSRSRRSRKCSLPCVRKWISRTRCGAAAAPCPSRTPGARSRAPLRSSWRASTAMLDSRRRCSRPRRLRTLPIAYVTDGYGRCSRRPQFGDTALHMTARNNHIECGRLLLNARANVQLANKVAARSWMICLTDASRQAGQSAMQLAATLKHIEFTRLLEVPSARRACCAAPSVRPSGVAGTPRGLP